MPAPLPCCLGPELEMKSMAAPAGFERMTEWIQTICARLACIVCTLARSSAQHIVALVELYDCAEFSVASSNLPA